MFNGVVLETIIAQEVDQILWANRHIAFVDASLRVAQCFFCTAAIVKNELTILRSLHARLFKRIPAGVIGINRPGMSIRGWLAGSTTTGTCIWQRGDDDRDQAHQDHRDDGPKPPFFVDRFRGWPSAG